MIEFIRKLFKPKNSKISTITMGLKLVECKECEKWYKGVELYEMFSQGPKRGLVLRYDKENETLILNEDMIMHALQLVSPMQKTRKLKFISYEEWRNS